MGLQKALVIEYPYILLIKFEYQISKYLPAGRQAKQIIKILIFKTFFEYFSNFDIRISDFVIYISNLAIFACVCMNRFRGSTSSPISIVNTSSACAASAIFTILSILFCGFIVVSHSCSGFISPKPLYL